jgi:hypothetical protein
MHTYIKTLCCFHEYVQFLVVNYTPVKLEKYIVLQDIYQPWLEWRSCYVRTYQE